MNPHLMELMEQIQREMKDWMVKKYLGLVTGDPPVDKWREMLGLPPQPKDAE